MYWHVHLDVEPWCLSYRTIERARRYMRTWGYTNHVKALISSDYQGPACPYREIHATHIPVPTKGTVQTMTVTMIKLDNGTEVDATQATCEGCNNSLADHPCTNGTGATASVTYSRSGKGSTRKKAEEKPPCAHCGAPMHFNMAASAVNALCIVMQYAVDKGIVTDPVHQKAPVLTIELMDDVAAWAKTLASPITYGGMLTAAGGTGTYSAGRPKTGRKKKATAAAPGSQIQDMAADETVDAVAEGEAAPKKRRGRKPRVSKLSVAENGAAVVEDVDLEEAVQNATSAQDEAVLDIENGPYDTVADPDEDLDVEDVDIEEVEDEAPLDEEIPDEDDDEPEAETDVQVPDEAEAEAQEASEREARAERRRQRKLKLAGAR